MADKRISQLIERVDIANNDVLPIVASGATTTNKVTISTIQDWMQENLDVGVTSVGITLGTSGNDVNVTGSPITTSGNITINIPTATATIRGLLSPTDFSTFNNKVPYTGANAEVNLGTNPLSASQININGASPTGGSYLGFKHSTSVTTGVDGYTSIYTFGTNNIGFQSISGSTQKDFTFSMVNITPGVPGGRVYNLPDASGTLALTSDITSALTGYVTLGTAQTITGSKTFNSRIIGQDATLTSSGSADTLEVTHTSGSGIAVDISKAGNGEGLRVAKTSGTGNAVTITGGTLSAEAGQFSGDLQSSTRLIAATGGQQIIITPNLSGTTNRIETTGSLPLEIVSGGNITFAAGGATPQITLATTGAVTLTGALNGTSASFTGNVSSGGIFIGRTTNGQAFGVGNGVDTDLGIFVQTNNILFSNSGASSGYAFAVGGSTRFSIASTGAATFSSSVTAGAATFAGTAGNQTPFLTLNATSANTTFNWVSQAFASNLSAGNNLVHFIGQSNSNKNSGYLGFKYAGAGSNDNILTLGLFGVDNVLNINGSGNVGVGTSSPNQKLHIGGVGSALAFDTTGGSGTSIIQTVLDFELSIRNNRGTSSEIRVGNENLNFYTSNVERMRITSGGDVSIGATSTNGRLGVRGTTNDSSAYAFEAANSSGNSLFLVRNDGFVGVNAVPGARFEVKQGGSEIPMIIDSSSISNGAYTQYQVGNSSGWEVGMGGSGESYSYLFSYGTFGTANSKVAITNTGDFIVGKASFVSNSLRIDANGILSNSRGGTGTNSHCNFFNDNGLVGSITTSGSSTSYNTSSDYRLKENVKPVENALSVLTQLKPCTFNFIADADEEVMGFIAHEVQEVIPQAVIGQKDEVRIEQVEVSPAELDEEGNVITEAVIEEKEVPVYQGIDHSKLVPLLVASIQELKAEIEALKSQING